MLNFPIQYSNGNASVTIGADGSRTVETPDNTLLLKYPLNVDVRLSRRCAYGRNPVNGKSVCGFCHESATTDGKDASFSDIEWMLHNLKELPAGAEVAVGINQFSNEVIYFLQKCYKNGWIVNATVNQGFLKRDLEDISLSIAEGVINGLGISYRKHAPDIPWDLVEYENTVVHVISGIDSIGDVKSLAEKGVKKILVLGEKDFGFNKGKVSLVSYSHVQWYRQLHELFKLFEVISFDNLALEQLNIKRFVKNWEQMYQHEYSFYVNAVDRTFAPSSRSDDVVPMMPVADYFKILFKGE